MPTVLCPSCGEKGRIPDTFIGHGIRCGKCGNRFLVTAPTKGSDAIAGQTEPQPGLKVKSGITVEGMDDAAWGESSAQIETPLETNPLPFEVHATGFTTEEGQPATSTREYKVLTQRDKFFAGKFDFGRLEDAINYYARQGWVVRGLVTPQVTGFSGGPKEEIMVLLEK